jgi:hypothetical protein
VDGLYEFATAGDTDVKARLVDAAGTEIAEQEDRPDDWNVQLAVRLAPGDYRLELAPTAAERGDPRRCATSRARGRPSLSRLRRGAPRRRGRGHPAGDPAQRRAAAAGRQGRASASPSIAAAKLTTLWSGIGRNRALEPLPPSRSAAARYRLRLWSLDRRGPAVAAAP